ncbi:MAG: lysophospholipase [Candidatus Thorarchaeota archaeon]|nr:lysophospholipase [Candidatus Thorarchaeota archaeon]
MEETNYIGYDNKQMFMRLWEPEGDSKAIVIALHGLGSHSGLMSFLGESFANRGYTCYAPDLRGFGQYDGKKGHIESFDEYVKDIEAIIAQLKLKHSDQKFFLYGHSFGALPIIHYVIKDASEVEGIMIPFPAVSERLEIDGFRKTFAGVLSKVNAKMLFPNGLNFDLLATNPEVVKRNREDPIRFDKVTGRFAVKGLKAKDEAYLNGARILLPVLVLQGGDDQITIPEKNKKFFDSISSEDKTWKQYDGLYHDPYEDEGGEEMLNDLLAWLDERAK